MEMKEQQAEAFNQANKIYLEAQKIKTESLKASKLEEEKSQVTFGVGGGEVNIQDMIKPEYLMTSPFTEIKLPTKVEVRVTAHKQEATCLCFNSIGDAVVTGGADNLIKIWSANTGKEVQTLRGFNKSITDVSISMDNEFLAGASTEHKAILWKLKTMRPVQSFSGHKE